MFGSQTEIMHNQNANRLNFMSRWNVVWNQIYAKWFQKQQ